MKGDGIRMKKLTIRGNMNERMDVVLRKFRSRMTSYPPGMCPIALYRSLLQISMNQSCGKCVPCRDGLAEIDHYLKTILDGDVEDSADGHTGMKILEEMEKKCLMIVRTAGCAVGTVAANLILESLTEFADEYESHIRSGRCVGNATQTVPCVTLCPAHVDVPGYIAMIRSQDYAGAVRVIRNRNPFPTACAFVCEHPCERKCRRAMVDAPINIRGLKKYAVDQAQADMVAVPQANVGTGRRIAVIGGGPSGMSAAYYLSLMGHGVDVFEEHEKPGGMLRYGIPEYRLPKQRLDEDLEAILQTGGIQVHPNTKVGRDVKFREIREKYDAVYIAVGAQLGSRMPMENADAKNVISAADFLQEIARGNAPDLTGKKVALIGGGHVAMDAARSAVRLHAESVHVFTRKRDDYTALDSEIIAAMQEGVRFRTLLSFLHIEADRESGEVCAVWLQPEIIAEYDQHGMMTTEHSSKYPYRFTCDLLILGVGQRSDLADLEQEGVPVRGGRVFADETTMVNGMDGVFSGGDCVSGPSTAIHAIAAGQVAAFNIDEYLGYHHKVSMESHIPPAYPNPCVPTGRAEIEVRDPFERKDDFGHVELSMTVEEAMRESGRCLRCDHYGCGVMEGGRGE